MMCNALPPKKESIKGYCCFELDIKLRFIKYIGLLCRSYHRLLLDTVIKEWRGYLIHKTIFI